MARTHEEPVQQPVVVSSSVTVSGIAEVLWYGMALSRRCRGRGVFGSWLEKSVEPKCFFWEGKFGLARKLGRNENQNYDRITISKI
jgi:hypothetical protein